MMLIIAETGMSLEDATAGFDWDGSNLTIEVESPAGVGKAQVKIDIPSELVIGEVTKTGFMSGATYMSSGIEHRWFHLSANGDTNGSITIPLTCSGNGTYIVNLTEISIKDTIEDSILFDVEFPLTQSIDCNPVPGDIDGDGEISDFELLSYIDRWVQEEVTDFSLLEAVDRWAGGG